MLECDGYKMFEGAMRITPAIRTGKEPFELTGIWLYRPDTKCWYCERKGSFTTSYPESVCSIM